MFLTSPLAYQPIVLIASPQELVLLAESSHLGEHVVCQLRPNCRLPGFSTDCRWALTVIHAHVLALLLSATSGRLSGVIKILH